VTDQPWYDAASQAVGELEAKLYAEFPEIVEAANAVSPPIVRLECPKGHQILSVTLGVDHNWHLFVAPANQESVGPKGQVAWAADPLKSSDADYDATTGPRVSLRCPHKGCKYKGTPRQERLLKLYAVAIRLHLTGIRVPS